MTATIFPFKYILSDENEGKYQSGDCWLIQYQILRTFIIKLNKKDIVVIFEVGKRNAKYFFYLVLRMGQKKKNLSPRKKTMSS